MVFAHNAIKGFEAMVELIDQICSAEFGTLLSDVFKVGEENTD
jgi:hypothetical protein